MSTKESFAAIVDKAANNLCRPMEGPRFAAHIDIIRPQAGTNADNLSLHALQYCLYVNAII